MHWWNPISRRNEHRQPHSDPSKRETSWSFQNCPYLALPNRLSALITLPSPRSSSSMAGASPAPPSAAAAAACTADRYSGSKASREHAFGENTANASDRQNDFIGFLATRSERNSMMKPQWRKINEHTAIQDPLPGFQLKKWKARSRLDRGRFLESKTHFATFLLYTRFAYSYILKNFTKKFVKSSQKLCFLTYFQILQICVKFVVFRTDFNEKFSDLMILSPF